MKEPKAMTGQPPAWSQTDEKPEQRINAILVSGASGQPRLTVATAESCTGGNVAGRLTSLAGSSEYVLGGIVAYSNQAKQSLLGVSAETLSTRGAVSAECAREMAEGARRAFDADLAVSTTGIAGPGGATQRKPVGLVYVALAGPEGTTAEEFHFPGGRASVTQAATEAALLMLQRGVEKRVEGKAEILGS